MPARHSGFTMIELVTVIILVGVLAVVAIPKLDSSVFSQRGFRDAVVAVLSHAREAAIGSRRYVCVNLVNGSGAAATVTVTRDPADPDTSPAAAVSCTAALPLPAAGSNCGGSNIICAPSTVSLGGTTALVFDPLGRSVVGGTKLVAASATITVSGQDDITVQSETGLVK